MSILTIEKLDKGFILTIPSSGLSSKREAFGVNTEEEILRQIAFFLTTEVGITVKLNRRKQNQTSQETS